MIMSIPLSFAPATAVTVLGLSYVSALLLFVLPMSLLWHYRHGATSHYQQQQQRQQDQHQQHILQYMFPQAPLREIRAVLSVADDNLTVAVERLHQSFELRQQQQQPPFAPPPCFTGPAVTVDSHRVKLEFLPGWSILPNPHVALWQLWKTICRTEWLPSTEPTVRQVAAPSSLVSTSLVDDISTVSTTTTTPTTPTTITSNINVYANINININNMFLLQQSPNQKWMYDYMSPTSFTPNSSYMRQALDRLSLDFVFLHTSDISRLLWRFYQHYAIAYDRVFQALVGYASDPWTEDRYDALLRALQRGELQPDQVERIQHLLSTTHRRSNGGLWGTASALLRTTFLPARKQQQQERSLLKPSPSLSQRRRRHFSLHRSNRTITNSILKEEVNFVQGKIRAWQNRIEQQLCRNFFNQASRREGTAVPCSCCFEDFDLGSMVACRDEGHLFCLDCVKSYAENQIFGIGNLGFQDKTKTPALELTCFHSSECSSGFSRASLEQALPPKTFEKYDEMQCKLNMDLAGMRDDLCTCPKCGFQVSLSQSQRTLCCPVLECQFKSCRVCGQEAHGLVRCEDPQEKQGRLTLEEAVTAAKIRTCPKCSKEFLKANGCNKVRCACGTTMCYLCRELIEDYSHFCQTPLCTHESCEKCSLWNNPDDDKAMREAAIVAAERWQKEVAHTAASAAGGSRARIKKFHIDVEAVLHDPAK